MVPGMEVYMLSLVLALIVAEPAAATAPMAAPAPQPAVKVAKMDALKCKWVVTKSGTARQFCLTQREWRDHQIDRQQRLDEFTKRQLTINLTH